MGVAVQWEVPLASWREFLGRCADATFFHTPGWYQTHAEGGGSAIRTALFRWSDGQEAILPLALRSRYRGWIREAVAGVENGYGGLLSPEALPPHRVKEAYQAVCSRYPNLRVLGNPLGRQQNLPEGETCETFTQVLPVLDPSSQRERMSDMRRRHLRKAEKAGFELQILQPVVPSDMRDLFPIYQEHSARWNYRRWVRDESYFRALFRNAGRDLVAFVARREGLPAGFLLLGCWGESLVELHLATREAMDGLQVGTYLIAKPLEWAHASGYRSFDFLPSGQLEGIVAYKESFGCERRRQVEVLQASRWTQLLGTLRGSVLARPRLSSTP